MCSECDEAFYRKSHFTSHIKVVNLKEKSFECSLYNKLKKNVNWHSISKQFIRKKNHLNVLSANFLKF